MRGFITIMEKVGGGVSPDEIKRHMFDSIMRDKHYEGGFNGIEHFTDAHHRDEMAQMWHRDGHLLSDDPEEPEFENVLRQWVDVRYDHVMQKLAAIPQHEGGYKVLRTIRVSPEWLDDYRSATKLHLGEYWTYDTDADVGSPWAKPDLQGYDITIEAIAPASGVNWEKTIMANMDWYSGDYEQEMRLFPNTPLRVTRIGIRGGATLATRGKSFYT